MKPGQHILVVDDDIAFRQRLVKALISRGHDVHGAGNVADALETAKVIKPTAAVIDLRMPGGRSGLDLVPDLVARYSGIQIVILTGFGSIATALEAIRKGAVNYLMKPQDTDQILQAFDNDHDDLPPDAAETIPTLARIEWEHIQRVLSDCEGNISLAARRLGIHRRSLQRKLAKLPPLE